MKTKLYLSVIVLTLFASVSFAQNRFSVGLVGTRFDNFGNEQKLTKTDIPVGYGIILGYNINKDFSVALTNEYFDEKDTQLKETNYRFHLSAFLTPFHFEKFNPYLSAGIVYSNQKYEYKSGSDETKNLFNGRIGIGLDYNILNNLFLNFDLGMYNDGLMFAGWSSSFGFRITPTF